MRKTNHAAAKRDGRRKQSTCVSRRVSVPKDTALEGECTQGIYIPFVSIPGSTADFCKSFRDVRAVGGVWDFVCFLFLLRSLLFGIVKVKLYCSQKPCYRSSGGIEKEDPGDRHRLAQGHGKHSHDKSTEICCLQ
ncbi:hypothetical protein L228DRAFT_9042 [Xylona heveae TC161]|uniref:Uncharacterized protein n=1 Tax=Xylona heveae (strain CBS 132557 / TC161) TaxID=1328760 RepID=A0A165JIG1_XYLHT|nr:hypothetical protein L228DRAFT_9042 [Xylona heveae TC161]KZF26281.1 hypothetical protein L228DRAFT_9042 [Xylona heveae TC161]